MEPLIQGTIKHFIFYPFKYERLRTFYRQSDVSFYDCITTIYHFIKHLLDENICFEEYGAFKQQISRLDDGLLWLLYS